MHMYFCNSIACGRVVCRVRGGAKGWGKWVLSPVGQPKPNARAREERRMEKQGQCPPMVTNHHYPSPPSCPTPRALPYKGQEGAMHAIKGGRVVSATSSPTLADLLRQLLFPRPPTRPHPPTHPPIPTARHADHDPRHPRGAVLHPGEAGAHQALVPVQWGPQRRNHPRGL